MHPHLSFGVYGSASPPSVSPSGLSPCSQQLGGQKSQLLPAVPAGVGTAQCVQAGIPTWPGPTELCPLLTKAAEGPSGLALPGAGDVRGARSLGEGLEPRCGTAMTAWDGRDKITRVPSCQVAGTWPQGRGLTPPECLCGRGHSLSYSISRLRTSRRGPRSPDKAVTAVAEGSSRVAEPGVHLCPPRRPSSTHSRLLSPWGHPET